MINRTMTVPFLVICGLTQMPLASDQQTTATADSVRQVGLWAEHIYNGVNRPVMIRVTSPRTFGTVTLTMMDFDGNALAAAVDVHPGRIDLAEVLPGIWALRKAAYLQMNDLEQPVGSALVVQPMLSRMVPVTETRPHPMTGQPYSRIVRWVDENDPAMQTPPSMGQSVGQATTQPDMESAARSIPRLLSGLRIYPEQDAIVHTTKGDIRLAMRADEAPNTVWNFLELARGGFFRGIVFHRVVKLDRQGRPFVIQAGDPTATGDGGPGYWLPIEDSRLPHDFGVISMARSDHPDSAGSQFFICLSREGTARLDGQYCSFGYAVDGAATIKAISEVQLADVAAGRPVDPPVIESVELAPAPPRTPNRGRPDSRITADSESPPVVPQTRPGRVPR
jgi:peptidyl-prolyl cis-trans isomerase B (cyclophilin B)